MVSKEYLAPHAPPNSAAKRFFDQRVMPVGINAAGAAEAAALRLGQAAKRSPATTMLTALMAGAIIAAMLAARRPPRRFRPRRW